GRKTGDPSTILLHGWVNGNDFRRHALTSKRPMIGAGPPIEAIENEPASGIAGVCQMPEWFEHHRGNGACAPRTLPGERKREADDQSWVVLRTRIHKRLIGLGS